MIELLSNSRNEFYRKYAIDIPSLLVIIYYDYKEAVYNSHLAPSLVKLALL